SRPSAAKAPGRSCWRCRRSSIACAKRHWNQARMALRMFDSMPGIQATKNPVKAGCFASLTKNPAKAGFFKVAAAPCGSGGLQRLDARGQAALVTGGLVLVDQATRAEAIENRLGNDERGLGGGGIIGVEGLEHLLDGGAQHRALGGVASVAHDSLLGALLGGLDIGHHGILGFVTMKSGWGDTTKRGSMGVSMAWVNLGGLAGGPTA